MNLHFYMNFPGYDYWMIVYRSRLQKVLCKSTSYSCINTGLNVRIYAKKKVQSHLFISCFMNECNIQQIKGVVDYGFTFLTLVGV